MRIIKFKIDPNKKTTDDVFFRSGETQLQIEAQQIEIPGLVLKCINVNGKAITTPLTELGFGYAQNDIHEYSFMRLEYESADKVYIIKAIIN
jgi:hypothetical protein